MALLLRRGLEANRLSFVPEEGELIYVTDTKLVYVGDGVTAGGNLLAGGGITPTPTYSLSRNSASVNEGGTVILTLVTTNVANGVSIPYTITGVSSTDIDGEALTGNFVTGSLMTLSFVVTADYITEGTETLTLTLNGKSTSITVTLNDTTTSTSIVDGGGTTPPSFDLVLDGGGPSTVFAVVIDGGTP
jgi:hypothetical protein